MTDMTTPQSLRERAMAVYLAAEEQRKLNQERLEDQRLHDQREHFFELLYKTGLCSRDNLPSIDLDQVLVSLEDGIQVELASNGSTHYLLAHVRCLACNGSHRSAVLNLLQLGHLIAMSVAHERGVEP